MNTPYETIETLLPLIGIKPPDVLGENPVALLSRALVHPQSNELIAYVDANGQLKNAAGAAFATVGSQGLDDILAAGANAGGLVISGLGSPSQASDAATKGYTDAALLGLRNRTRVRVATTAHLDILSALSPGNVLDGVTLATGDRVLVKDLSTPTLNGIWVVAAVAGAPSRSPEFNTFAAHAGVLCAVEEGTANADTVWLCTSNESGTLGSTALDFARVRLAADGPRNIKDYGAVGNGVANDTAAVLAAVAAACASGRSLYVPAGTYLCTAEIPLTGSFTIFGEGQARSVFRFTTAASHGFHLTAISDRSSLRDLGIAGPNFAGWSSTSIAGSATGDGIKIDGVVGATDLIYFARIGICGFARGISGVDVSNCCFDVIDVSGNSAYGAHFTGNCNSNVLRCFSSQFCPTGVYLGGGRVWKLMAGDFGGTATQLVGIHIEGCTACISNTNHEQYAGICVKTGTNGYVILESCAFGDYGATEEPVDIYDGGQAILINTGTDINAAVIKAHYATSNWQLWNSGGSAVNLYNGATLVRTVTAPNQFGRLGIEMDNASIAFGRGSGNDKGGLQFKKYGSGTRGFQLRAHDAAFDDFRLVTSVNDNFSSPSVIWSVAPGGVNVAFAGNISCGTITSGAISATGQITASGLMAAGTTLTAGTHINLSAGGQFYWQGRTVLKSDSDGDLKLRNNADNAYGILSAKLNGCTDLPLSTGVTGVLPLANGGTGAALSDPNSDRLMFWDDSAGSVAFLTVGSGLNISGTTITASGGGGGGGGDMSGPGVSTDTGIVLWDGTGGTLTKDSVVTIDGSGNIAGVGVLAAGDVRATLLKIPDSNASHFLSIAAGSDLSADRTLTVTTGDAARTLTIFGSTTIPVASQQITIAGPTAARTYTFPDASATIARTDAANTFTGTQTIGALVVTTINGLTVTSSTGTLTLVNGSSLITAGAFAVTLTATGTTGVTLPTTGTLATLAGAESLTNKKLGSLTSNGIVTTSSGDGTLSVTATTGSGSVVLATSPTLVTPAIGVATATSINGNTFTAGSYTLTGGAGKTLTFSNSITLAGTDSTTMTFPGTSQTIAGLTATQTLSAKQIRLTAAHGTDDTWEGQSITGLNAGATIAQWEAVYLGGSSTWLLADADGSGTFPARGLAVAAYSNTNAAEILVQGTARNDAWNWTPGGAIYLSTTAGGLTQTAPASSGNKVQQVGFALTADIAYFNFNGEYLTLS